MPARKTTTTPEPQPFTEVSATAGAPVEGSLARSIGDVVEALFATDGVDLELGVTVTVVDGIITATGKVAAQDGAE